MSLFAKITKHGARKMDLSAHLVLILVVDDQHDQVELMNLQVFIFYSVIGCERRLGPRWTNDGDD